MKKKYCLIGLGKIGENLLYSLVKQKFDFDFWDQDTKKIQAIGKKINKKPIKNINMYLKKNSVCAMLFIPHNKVESFLEQKLKFFKQKDIIIDFGNSHPLDTKIRYEKLKKKKILFFGIGFSGGVKGAKKIPCLMISGKKNEIKKISLIINVLLKKKSKKNFLIVGESAETGHFAKICHNAIEYSIMQILSEYYLFNKEILKKNTIELTKSFSKLNEFIPKFYLGKISEKIARGIVSKLIKINSISDKIDHNNTSKWYNLLCLQNDIPCPNLLSSFESRILSRSEKNISYRKKNKKRKNLVPKNFAKLFKFLITLCYLQGIVSLKKICKIKKTKIKIKNVIKVWQFNSIISSDILNFKEFLISENIKDFYSEKEIKNFMNILSDIIKVFISENFNPTGLYSSYKLLSNHLQKTNTENSFIQVQRNFFGNHKLVLN